MAVMRDGYVDYAGFKTYYKATGIKIVQYWPKYSPLY